MSACHRLVIAAVLTICLIGPVLATDAPSEAGGSIQCRQVACRSRPAHVILRSDVSGDFEADFDALPYVINGRITIFPGEALVFRFSPTADEPGVPVFVRAIAAPEPVHLASDYPNAEKQADPKSGENYYVLRQGSSVLDNGTAAEHLKDEPPGTMILFYNQVRDRPDMVLRIEHNLAQPLKFDTQINRLVPNRRTGMEHTSTCPAFPVLADMETWPYTIGAITLERFRFIATDGGFNCD
jgi:hypothetical protein